MFYSLTGNPTLDLLLANMSDSEKELTLAKDGLVRKLATLDGVCYDMNLLWILCRTAPVFLLYTFKPGDGLYELFRDVGYDESAYDLYPSWDVPNIVCTDPPGVRVLEGRNKVVDMVKADEPFEAYLVPRSMLDIVALNPIIAHTSMLRIEGCCAEYVEQIRSRGGPRVAYNIDTDYPHCNSVAWLIAGQFLSEQGFLKYTSNTYLVYHSEGVRWYCNFIESLLEE